MQMKKLWIILCGLMACAGMAAAERVYVSTDRTAYLAGERVWCSLFCVDENGRLSPQSAVAYVELLSAEGSAVQQKIGLLDGRGSGEFALPVSLPTGNYRLVAYTMLEGAEAALCGSRILSIYQPYSVARLKDGVLLGAEPVASVQEEVSKGLEARVNRVVRQGTPFTVILSGALADVSVSVFHEDDLFQVPLEGIDTFLEDFPLQEADLAGGFVEYEGEVVRARAIGADPGSLAVLSSSGSPDDTYISRVHPDGSLEFVTSNIYGDRELVCEILEGSTNVSIQLLDNYLHPSAGEIPPLRLQEGMYASLVRRKDALSLQPVTDSLMLFLPRREDQLFSSVTWEWYHLDDYTRFSSVNEIIVEILTSVRMRRDKGIPYLEVTVSDGTDNRRTYKDHILTMVDGVVVSDLRLLQDFDAMLLEDVYVCRDPFVSGQTLFNGAVNFVTKNNYVTALHFPEQVCVVDFQGVRYPVAYPGGIPASCPDRRELLYWHPALQVEGETRLNLTAPSYEGRFRVVAEGVTTEGKPVKSVTSFTVR